MCKNWREKGNCKYGDRCLFAHGENELTRRTSAPEKPPTPELKVEPASTETKPDEIVKTLTEENKSEDSLCESKSQPPAIKTSTDLKDLVKTKAPLAFLTPDKICSKGRLLQNEATTVTKASTTA